MRLRRSVAFVVLGFAAAAGCSSSDGADEDGTGGTGGPDGGGSGGSAADGGSSATGGSSAQGGTAGAGATTTGGTGGAGATGDGGPCVPATCQGKTYKCGNCEDDDGDGLIDMRDPDCLGPCHDSESVYHGCIAGQAAQPCIADCYFDQDSGDGNDTCHWDRRCDPYGTNGAEGNQCPYLCNGDNCNTSDPAAIGECVRGCNDRPPAGGTCSGMYDTQPSTCESFCGPLTPNGCDCFGCCELPRGSGKYVYLGSTSDDSGRCEYATCDIEAANAGDTTKCKSCTPVAACLNTCERCECCLGDPDCTLPDDCRPDAGGTPDAGGCVAPICPEGVQSCGPSCLPACPTGTFCLTGCCRDIPE